MVGDAIEVSELDPGGELIARVAALDIAKASAMVCTRVPGSWRTIWPAKASSWW